MAHNELARQAVLGKAAIGMARVARSSDVKRTFRRSLADLDSGIPNEFAPNMKNHGIRSRPFFLSSTACSLREACREVGRDENGRRCPTCPVKSLCKDESRWVVRRDRKPLRYVN